jgi:arachidonate 15-lipoxygenase
VLRATVVLIFATLVIKMTNTLPQDNATDQEYQYSYDAFVHLAQNSTDAQKLKYPMTPSVFYEDNSLTKGNWTKDVLSTLLRIRSNQTMYDVAIKEERCSTLQFVFDIRFLTFIDSPNNSRFIAKIYSFLLWIFKFSYKSPASTPETADGQPRNSYAKSVLLEKAISEQVKSIQRKEVQSKKTTTDISFKNYKELFQIIYLPCTANQAQSDKAFAMQRVAGVNPVVIERLLTLSDKFPITDGQYRSVMGHDDSLQQALTDKRLYITDYQVLSEIQPGTVTINDDIIPKFIYQPIALFAVEPGNCPNRRLVPVAIQCYQQPAPDNPIFVAPALNASDSERWAWQIAKMTVQIADANYQEFISHLGGTHLWMEPIAISIYRTLPPDHPLGALLRPHIEGTLFINDSAVKGLVNLGGTVDKVAAGTLESSLLLSIKGAKGYPFAFNDSSLPQELQQRGVDDPNCLPDYPYRDDALLLWQAIHDWVTSYLTIFYMDNNAVANDYRIQNWIKDLTDPNGGQMTGIGETDNDGNATPQIKTLAYLIKSITLIIFTGSVQHAAVNFPQSTYMTYMPNMPLAGYDTAPSTSDGITKEDYFALLPSLQQAETQMNMTHLLGSIYYTQLGEYGKAFDQLENNRIAQPLQDFQNKLKSIELQIQARNEVRSIHYDVLRPSKIPQSINI